MSGSVWLTLAAQTVRTSVPYVAAAVGGVLSERSGVVNIALEGMLLAGGLAAVVTHLATGSPWAGLAAGIAVGAAMGMLHAFVVVRGRVDAILSGIAINLLAAGGSRFVLRALYRSSSNSPPIDGFRWGGDHGLLVRTFSDPTLYVALGALGLVLVLFRRTAFGLRVRAAGEDPTAVEAAGLSVARLRIQAVVIGGGIVGVGGVALAYDQHQFQSGMSGGRGFIALATVVLSGWRPGRAALACVAFAALDAFGVLLQDRHPAAHDLVEMIPYLVTLVVLGVAGARARARMGSNANLVAGGTHAPAALGRML